MGSTQSQEKPSVVRIDRKDVPEGYNTVGVSSDVVARVNAQQQGTAGGEAEKLRSELAKEREEKTKLRDEMSRLSQLQQRSHSNVQPVNTLTNDIEERKKIFEETVDRVQQQFFQYQRENVCQEQEKEILAFLEKNPNRVLNCTPLVEKYEQCAADFRSQVLNGQ